MIFRTLYGVDLGTDTIKLRDRSGKKFLECRNMIAVRNDGRVLAVGDDAYEMFEKNPEDVEVSSPMSGGVIASATNMELVLTDTLRKFTSFTKKSSGLCLAVPSNLTPVEQRAFFNVLSTGRVPGRVRVVEKGIADGASIGLAVLSSAGHMLVNIGASTTEISVISSGKVILSSSLKIGGQTLDSDIATMIRRKFNISIGMKTAEHLKNNLAFMINGPRLEQPVFGIHTLSGLPKSDRIPSLAVSVAIIDTIDRITQEIRSVFDRIPPQLMRDIEEEGIFLTGVVSMILNLPIYMQKELGLPIYHIQDPKNSTIRGILEIINNKELSELMHAPQL
jgi:rod shape-determining protein MreB